MVQEGLVGRGLGLAPSQSTNHTFVECLSGASAEGTQSGANQGPGCQGPGSLVGGMAREQVEQEVSLGVITEPVGQTSSVRRLGTGWIPKVWSHLRRVFGKRWDLSWVLKDAMPSLVPPF